MSEQYELNWKDYYDILQVSPRADSDVITAAYRKLAQKHHPDTCLDPSASERMQELNEAYEVLSSPLRRARYDTFSQTRNLDRKEPRPTGSDQNQPKAYSGTDSGVHRPEERGTKQEANPAGPASGQQASKGPLGLYAVLAVAVVLVLIAWGTRQSAPTQSQKQAGAFASSVVAVTPTPSLPKYSTPSKAAAPQSPAYSDWNAVYRWTLEVDEIIQKYFEAYANWKTTFNSVRDIPSIELARASRDSSGEFMRLKALLTKLSTPKAGQAAQKLLLDSFDGYASAAQAMASYAEKRDARLLKAAQNYHEQSNSYFEKFVNEFFGLIEKENIPLPKKRK